MNIKKEYHHQNRQNYPQVAPGKQVAAVYFAAVRFAAVEHRPVPTVAVVHYTAAAEFERRPAPTVAGLTADSLLPVLPCLPGDRPASASGQ